jgi:hypothetical protein
MKERWKKVSLMVTLLMIIFMLICGSAYPVRDLPEEHLTYPVLFIGEVEHR